MKMQVAYLWSVGAGDECVCGRDLQFIVSLHENKMHAKEMVSNIQLVKQTVLEGQVSFKYPITFITVLKHLLTNILPK